MGNLFISNFKRKKIESDSYLTNLIKYIHLNPVTHHLVKDASQWKFSSFNAIRSTQQTFIARKKVLAWFGGIEEFTRHHGMVPKV